MVSNKHCRWGDCKLDSQYPDNNHKFPKSAQKVVGIGRESLHTPAKTIVRHREM